MTVLIVCIKRLSALTREEFSRHWREIHGPLVASVPEFTRHVRKYVQYHMIDAEALSFPMFGDLSDYDGVAALWFDNIDAIKIALNEPRYLEIIRPDEARFIDADNCRSFVTSERVMI